MPSGKDTVVRLLGFTVHVHAPETDSWTRYYLDLANRARNIAPVFEAFGAYMVGVSLPHNFEAEGRPERWARLSPAYADWKARHYPGRKILELTGAMKWGFEWKATPRTLKIWNRQPYWAYHQKGTRKMPRRVTLLLQTADRAMLTRMVRSYVRTGEVEPR